MSSAAGKVVVFYHSVVCPRCQVSKLALRKALRKHPDIEVKKVEFLTNMGRAKQAGVHSIPALVADGRTLKGVVLTPGRIERFLESLDSDRE
jgi:predicted DsbA family dithiol-disulfide isomerase